MISLNCSCNCHGIFCWITLTCFIWNNFYLKCYKIRYIMFLWLLEDIFEFLKKFLPKLIKQVIKKICSHLSIFFRVIMSEIKTWAKKRKHFELKNRKHFDELHASFSMSTVTNRCHHTGQMSNLVPTTNWVKPFKTNNRLSRVSVPY